MLVVLSALFAILLTWMRLPAALMLGPMIAGMLVEAGQPAIRLPRLPFNIAQGIIGCMIASVLTLAIILGGVAIGYVSKLPAGMLLVPLFAGTAFHVSGLVEIELPRWLLAAGYLCIGSRFVASRMTHFETYTLWRSNGRIWQS